MPTSYSKVALAGFILGPIPLFLLFLADRANAFFAKAIDPNWGLALLPVFLALIPTSLILAVISLFLRRENQKGQGLAIITLVAPILFIACELVLKFFR